MSRGRAHFRTPPALHKFTVRQIDRDEVGRLLEPRAKPDNVIAQLRDSHHKVARLLAAGLRPTEVAERSGYSLQSICRFQKVPAFQELLVHYRSVIDEAFAVAADEYATLSTANMIAAERHIADTIAELDEKGELLPVKTALAISADKADRFGYGKKQTNLNVNVDFAKNLEGMIRRSGKVIDAVSGASLRTLAGSPEIAATEARSLSHKLVPPVAGPPPPRTAEEYRRVRRI